MRKKNSKDQPDDKILDVNASMQGTLRFDDPVNLRINGKFEGTLDTKGMLLVGRNADIDANIVGESISVAGKIKGNISARKSLALEATAAVTGDVETSNLSIDEGAVLNGRITMGKSSSSSSSRGDWMNTDQLAKYLEVDENKVGEWASGGMLPATKEAGKWVFERSKIDQWIAEGKVSTKA